MRLLFIVLAHDQPGQCAELARTLVATASDAQVMIHFDQQAPAELFLELERAVAGEGRIHIVKGRVRCSWGSFGLVEAPLNALAEARALGLAPGYVILLSGACLPCRPLEQLERFLAGHRGREFIEAYDQSWMRAGLRDERHKLYFLVDHKRHPRIEHSLVQVQRFLRIKRSFPAGLIPRFGSQWWALTWKTCEAILDHLAAHPRQMRYFRRVWIPDEMMFQTLVYSLVGPKVISGFGLTHFHFSDKGKPLVFHDDHVDYVPTLPRFFFRKASAEAKVLRARCLAVAGEKADGAALTTIGRKWVDYDLKIKAQTHYPRAGQAFYRDQYRDSIDPVLARATAPYVVVVGPPCLTGLVTRHFQAPTFDVLGEIFSTEAVDLGDGPDGPRQDLGGIGRKDVEIRDLHPALFLVRVRSRCSGVPVIRWSPLDHGGLLDRVLQDAAATVIGCFPQLGDPEADYAALMLTSGLPAIAGTPIPPAPDRAIVAGDAARLRWEKDAYLETLLPPAGSGLAWLDAMPLLAGSMDRQPRATLLVAPWALGNARLTIRQRRSALRAARRAARSRTEPWMQILDTALQEAWRAHFTGDVTPLLTPPPGPQLGGLLQSIGGSRQQSVGRDRTGLRQPKRHRLPRPVQERVL